MPEGESRPRRSRLAVWTALAGLSALCLLQVLRGIILPPIILTNKVSGVDSLGAVLADPETSGRLEELAACLPLWRIAGEAIAEDAHTFHFDFAEPQLESAASRLHSRVYRLTATARRSDGTSYAVTGWREAYASAPELLERPFLEGSLALRMLRLALADPAVREGLAEAFGAGGETRDLFEVTVVPSSSLGIEPTQPERDFVVGFHWDAGEGDTGAESRYWRGRHDEAVDSATFETLPR